MAGRSDIEAGKAHILLFVKNSALVKGLNAAKKQLQGFGTSILKIGGFLSDLGESLIRPLVEAVGTFASMGSELADLSARTGESVGSLAELKFAAEQTGASLADIEIAIRNQQKKGVKGTFDQIAAEIAAIEDPAKRTTKAMDVWGKAGTKLLPMVENLQALRKEARDLGLVPTEQAVKMADDVGDAVDKIKSVLSATVFEVGAALAPMLLPALETVKNIAGWFNRWAKQNGAIIRTVALIAAGVLGAGVAVTAIGALVFGLGTAFGLVASVITTLAGLLGTLLSPVGLIVAALVAGVAAWARFTASGQATVRAVMAGLTELLRVGREVIGGIGDALAAGDLALAGQIAIKGLQVVFLQGVAALADMLGGTLGDAVGTIGTKVLQGDLAGAWQTVVKGMATLWADFAEGVVAVFTQAARAVTDLWQKTVSGISDAILEASAQGGVLGKVASTVLGVDLAAEQERTNKLNAQLGLTTTDITKQAKEDARAQVAATADVAREFLDGLDQSFREQSDAARQDFGTSIAGGGSKARDEAARLAAELEELRKQAAQAREAAAARAAGGDAAELPGAGGSDELKAAASGTFSALGAVALGFGGGGPTQRIVKATEKTNEKLDVIHKDNIELNKKLVPAVAAP